MTTGALRSPAGERTEPGAVATGPAAAEAAPAVVTPPPGNPRFPLLDSLRAVAAMMVLLAHAMLVAAGRGVLTCGGTRWLRSGSRE